MIDIPTPQPILTPVASPVGRPLWSVMIPVYNCARFLPETLRSVLRQQLPETEMQIEVIDDASIDTDVEALVLEIGQGRIKYYRQPHNMGSPHNFETCLNRAKGELVHLLHGDDKIREGFYTKIASLFRRYPEAGAAFCRYSCINEHGARIYEQGRLMQKEGILQSWLPRIAERQRTQSVAKVVRREVYEKLGGFYGITYGEDWEMWVRIARNYPVAYIPDILADYRKHAHHITGDKYLTGQNMKDLVYVMEIIQTYLPPHQRKEILRKSKRYYASFGIKTATKLWIALQNKQAVNAQIKQALRLHKTPALYWKIFKLYCNITLEKA